MPKKQQTFDAVGFQRRRRPELSKLLASNPGEFEKRMLQVQKKYKNKFHRKSKLAA